MGRLSLWVLFGLTLLAVSFNDVLVNAEVGPTESECRPYIEKAIHELKTSDSDAVDDDDDSGETKQSNENSGGIDDNNDDDDDDDNSKDDDSVEGPSEDNTDEAVSAGNTETTEVNTDEDGDDDDDDDDDDNDPKTDENDNDDDKSDEKETEENTAESKEGDDDDNAEKSAEADADDDSEEAQKDTDEQSVEKDANSKESGEAETQDDDDSKEPASKEAEDDVKSNENADDDDDNKSDETDDSKNEQDDDDDDSAEKALKSDEDDGDSSEKATMSDEKEDDKSGETESAEDEKKAGQDDNDTEENDQTEEVEDVITKDVRSQTESGKPSAEQVDQDDDSKEGDSKAADDDDDDDDSKASADDDDDDDEKDGKTSEHDDDDGQASGESKQDLDDSKEDGADDSSDKKSEEVDASTDGDDDDDDSQAVKDDDDDESEESHPEDDLLMEEEIPTNLRDRKHISEILHLDDEFENSEKAQDRVAEIILRDIKRIYENAIKPLETLYKYRDLSNRHFGDPEIFSKPLVLFMGPWSGGKSSIINYLTDNEYKSDSLRTGAEPSPAYFNLLMWGNETGVLDGTQLAADWTFSGLQKFGEGLEDRLRGLKMPSKLLEKVNIVEIPGILEVRKQVSRLFPFNDACQWFIDRADIIVLVYDPAKLDAGPETEAILDQLKGREYQTRIILNKADTVKPEELLRVQSALIWNISPLMSSAQPPVMYTTSLWSRPFESNSPIRLLQAQERAFLKDLRTAVDKRIENRIASARRFAVRVRNHAKMVDCYLNTYYNHKTIFGNKKRISDEIIQNPQDYHIYEGLSTLTNISRYDLPDPEVYRDFFRLNPLYEFKKLSETCTYFRGCPIHKLDVAIAYDLPELVGKYKKMAEQALASLDSTSDSHNNKS